jgi:diguanylate cyclase (GGDEF)-like protein
MSELPLPISLRQEVEILVVDDSRVQAKLLKDLLESRGYAVRVATNGQEALHLIRDKRPTLIISDIVMPVMNGYDMCYALKQDPGYKNVPVILLTSLSDIEDIVLGLMAQADYYLTKPYSNEYLLSTIASILTQPSLPAEESPDAPLEVTINQSKHAITASRRQMMSLLLSTYGNAVEQNRVLLEVQRELKSLNDQLREQAQHIVEQQRRLEEANTQLQALATHDGLTKLKNHRAFKEKLADELSRAARYGQPVSLLLLDIDNFKQYNDTFGHPAGDDVLQIVARLLRENSRSTDFVARYGGEEFAILLPNTDASWAIHLGERLRSAIEREPWTRRAVTASFGAATYDEREHEEGHAADLLEAADRALYHSKRNGRNRITHQNELST